MGDPNLRVYDNILQLIPNEDNPTPLVKLNKVHNLKAEVYAKLEWYNPFGSVKDRVALSLLRDAQSKLLLDGKKVIEPTSGNTGIALTAIANMIGLKVRNTVSSEIPEEKKNILRFLGSEVIEVSDSLCPDPTSKSGAIGLAKSTAENLPNKFYMPNQYENEANFLAHYRTTGPEIWKQTGGKITHFIAGLGTCGTIGGISKFLKEKNPEIKTIAVYPEESHDIPGVRSLKQLKVTKLFRQELYDEMVEVANKESYEMCLRLNREESLIAGPSSGMALAGALKAIKESGLAVIIFPDNVFKYTSFLEKNFPDICSQSKTVGAQPVAQEKTESDKITPKQLKEMIEKKEEFILLDVREPHEYQICHIEGTKLIPVNQVQEKISELDSQKEIVVYCHSGGRSMFIVKKLKTMGFKNVKNLEGGIDAWAAEIEPEMARY